jgi:hypothetical protein
MTKKLTIDTNGFELGDEARDPITGFTGRIIGFTQWFSGCAIASLQPAMKTDGEKIPEHVGFDVTRIIKISAATATSQRATGGPQPVAPERGG